MDDVVVSRIAHESCTDTPNMMPANPWWSKLESNFARRPEGFELGLKDKLAVGATAAIDRTLRTVASTALLATALPLGYNPARMHKMFDNASFYRDLTDADDPSEFFRKPPTGVRVRSKRARFPFLGPKEGTIEDLRFESPFEPVNRRFKRRYTRFKKNMTAHARYWRHDGGPRPTIVAIHGFGADPYWLNERLFALKWFFKIGCDVMLYTLPFHGRRQPRLSPFSGYGFFAGGVSFTNEAVAQAVHDFRIFFDYLTKERNVPRIGVTGISLGGYTSAILAVAEPRLAFSVPNVPLASLADLMLEWVPISTVIRSAMLATGRTIKDLRHMFAVHSPLSYKPVIPRDRLMIIGGVGDRLAPPKHSRLLWDHWDRCQLHWFPGSHFIHLDRGAYLRQMGRFINKIGFINKSDGS